MAGAARLGLRAGDPDQRRPGRQQPSVLRDAASAAGSPRPRSEPSGRRRAGAGRRPGHGRGRGGISFPFVAKTTFDPSAERPRSSAAAPSPPLTGPVEASSVRPVDVDVDVHRVVAVLGDERRFGFEGDRAGVVGDGGDPVGEDQRVFVDARVGRPGAEQQRRRPVRRPVEVVRGVVIGGAELRPRFEDRDRAVGGERDRPVAAEAAPGPAVGAARDQRRSCRPAGARRRRTLRRCPRARPRCWSRRGRCRRRPRHRRSAGMSTQFDLPTRSG